MQTHPCNMTPAQIRAAVGDILIRGYLRNRLGNLSPEGAAGESKGDHQNPPGALMQDTGT